MFKKILSKLVARVTHKEYKNPPFGSWNERPVEYGFLFERISQFYPKTLLDVGTGVTALPHLIANCGIKVTAIDNVRDYWKGGMFNRHFFVVDDDITDTKLTDKFDMVSCISTLEHIEKYDAAVANMFKLLNPGGHLVLTCPYNERAGVPNVYTLPEANIKKVPDYPAKAFSREDLERWQKNYGARVVSQEYWQFFTGEYWTLGEPVLPPKKVGPEEKHQISCILFEKS